MEQWNFVDNLANFLQGTTAMTISWPPYGRWAAGYGSGEEALNWVPKSQVAGKVGYALNPLGRDELGVGFALSVSTTSKKKEAAYLFIQWLNSKQISLERVQLPYTLRDPFRTSHYESPEYRKLWPDAPAYLDTIKKAGETGLLDLSLLQQDKYDEAMTKAISSLWTGEDPKAIVDRMASQFDAITEKVGVDKQKEVYKAWAAKPGAYPKGLTETKAEDGLAAVLRYLAHMLMIQNPTLSAPPLGVLRQELQISDDCASNPDPAARRAVPAHLFADRQLPEHHDDGRGHFASRAC